MYWPSERELNELDMSGILTCLPETETEFRGYVNSFAGREHYRLLKWLSDSTFQSQIVEIGVYKGCSGVALSQNPANNVIGFDLINNVTCTLPNNYKLIFDDYRNYTDIIKSSNFIFYDTNHDGVLETQFIEYIKKIKYKGLVIFDDIYLNNQMISFWREMNYSFPCMDLTRIGHCTGTGVIWV